MKSLSFPHALSLPLSADRRETSEYIEIPDRSIPRIKLGTGGNDTE